MNEFMCVKMSGMAHPRKHVIYIVVVQSEALCAFL